MLTYTHHCTSLWPIKCYSNDIMVPYYFGPIIDQTSSLSTEWESYSFLFGNFHRTSSVNVLNRRSLNWICFMHHFTFWTWIISRFNRAWLYKDQKIWNFQHMLDWHQTCKPVMVSAVLLEATLILLIHLDANLVQKWQKCQICVIYENLCLFTYVFAVKCSWRGRFFEGWVLKSLHRVMVDHELFA